jgi:hypothetical protein
MIASLRRHFGSIRVVTPDRSYAPQLIRALVAPSWCTGAAPIIKNAGKHRIMGLGRGIVLPIWYFHPTRMAGAVRPAAVGVDRICEKLSCEEDLSSSQGVVLE